MTGSGGILGGEFVEADHAAVIGLGDLAEGDDLVVQEGHPCRGRHKRPESPQNEDCQDRYHYECYEFCRFLNHAAFLYFLFFIEKLLDIH